MDPYLLLRYAHVVLAIWAVGSNLTYRTLIALAGEDPGRIRSALHSIRVLDRLANVGYILLLVTGVALAALAGIPYESFWISASLALYLGAVALGIFFFAPAMRRQRALLEERGPADPAYRAVARRTSVLWVIAALDVLAIVFLMVTKPAF